MKTIQFALIFMFLSPILAIEQNVYPENERSTFIGLSSLQDLPNINIGQGVQNPSTTLYVGNDKYPGERSRNGTLYIDQSVQGQKDLLMQLRTDDKEFHLVSHGRPGELWINNKWHSPAEIHDWIKSNYDISDLQSLYIYGCHFAKGEKGIRAVSYLESVLGIPLVASDDITGVDGDWEFEVGNGMYSIEPLNYPYNLQCPSGEVLVADTQYAVTATGNAINSWGLNLGGTGEPDIVSPGGVDAVTRRISIYNGQSVDGKLNVFSYTDTFTAGAEIVVYARDYNTNWQNGVLQVLVSEDGINWSTSIGTLEPQSTTSYGTYTFTVPPSLTGDYSYIQLTQPNPNGIILVDAVGVISDVCVCDPDIPTSDCDGDGVLNGQDCDPETVNSGADILDTDGDGVLNYCDFDDDNDGILDIEECFGTISIPNGTQTVDGLDWEHYENSTTNLSQGGKDPAQFDMTRDADGWWTPGPTLLLTQTGSTAGGVEAPDVAGDEVILVEKYFVGIPGEAYTITWNDNGTHDGFAMRTLNSSGATLDRLPKADWYYYYDESNVPHETDYAVATSDFYNTYTFTGTVPADGVIKFEAIITDPSAAHMDLVDALSTYNLAAQSSAPVCADLDNDGLINSKDLDSDGDGCPDMLEGGGTFTSLQCNSSSINGGNAGTGSSPVTCNITTTDVDANGVPTVAGSSGQSVGDSQDNSVQNSECANADLRVDVTISNSNPVVGENVIISIEVCNDGPADATGVQVTNPLPSGYSYVSDNGSGTYNSGSGLWSVGNLDNGVCTTLQITASVNSSGDYYNSAQVTASDQPDPDSTPNNNISGEDDQDHVSINTSDVADLSLTKTVNNTIPSVGDEVTFSIVLSNSGSNSATHVGVADQLPNGYTYVSSSTSQGSYDNGTGVWDVGTIASGGSASLQITATVNASGDYNNIAQVTSSDQDDPDSVPDNDEAGEDDQDSASILPVSASSCSAGDTQSTGVMYATSASGNANAAWGSDNGAVGEPDIYKGSSTDDKNNRISLRNSGTGVNDFTYEESFTGGDLITITARSYSSNYNNATANVLVSTDGVNWVSTEQIVGPVPFIAYNHYYVTIPENLTGDYMYVRLEALTSAIMLIDAAKVSYEYCVCEKFPDNPECMALPIELLEFNVVKDGNIAILDWVTGSEENNDYFTIEHSSNLIDFEQIAKVSSHNGNSTYTQYYQYKHLHPSNGVNYYRLKQTDFDGGYEYSDIVKVVIDDMKNDLKIYPNPSNGILNVYLPTEQNSSVKVEIINISGQVVLATYEWKEGQLIQLNVGDFIDGLYFIQIQTSNQLFRKQFIISK